jgi:hypothetical protein
MMVAPTRDDGGWAERVDRLIRRIPGLGRYQDREGLRDADKRIRTYLAELLADLGREIEAAERRLAEATRLDRLASLDRIGRQVATLADRIRFASYGFTGVFGQPAIRERELAELHGFDLRLLEEIPRLQSQVRIVTEATGPDQGFSEALQGAETAVRQFERTVDERNRLARGL